jgi:hypothetical protein
MDVTDPENIRAIDIPSDLYTVLEGNIAGGKLDHDKGF